MTGMEGMHGDWQHMTGDDVEKALERGAQALEGGEGALAVEDTALAVGGEGAAELEATAPGSVTVLEPLSEAEREEMRRENWPDQVHTGIYGLEPGPDGQYITGSPGA